MEPLTELPVFRVLLSEESLVEISSRQPPECLEDDVGYRQTPGEVVGNHVMNQDEPGGADEERGYEPRTKS